ncbi:MAG: helix-turn-helix domain-containing protein [Planctomycetota bacterium]|nr:helix-turn-helix domain-containing protein [Planctomycetota bacterium]
MADLLNLNEAAEILNVTNEELVSFSKNGDIKSYRDGDDQKFKRADLEQFASDRGIQMVDSDLLDLLDDDDEEQDASDATVAGDPLGLDDDSFSLLDDDMEGDGEDSVLITKQDLNAMEAATPDQSGDELALAGDGPLELEDSNELFADDMNFDMDDDSTIMAPGTNIEIGNASSDEETQLGLVEDFGVTDGDLVLGGMDSSDVTLGSEDSGITLESPSDSGILLDGEAVDLADSESTELELPGAAGGMGLLIEDDNKSFNLGTPDGSEEMSDSGSQVIAISDSVALDDGGMEPIASLDELGGSLDQLDEVSPGENLVPAGIAPPVPVELGYSAWIVMCLMMITLVLVLTGMMMADVVKTMWSWNEGTNLSSSVIMDTIIEMFNMRPGP